MSRVADNVMNSIIAGCKAEAKRQVKEELNFLKIENKSLKKDNVCLKKKIKTLERKLEPFIEKSSLQEDLEKEFMYLANLITRKFGSKKKKVKK